jgi:translation elongation factor EF-Tu-like GTPase
MMHMHPYAEVLITLLRTEKGGRQSAIEINDEAAYRPHFRVAEGVWLGVEFVDGPSSVAPGESTYATVRFLYEPEIDYRALVVGAQFDILEGNRVVGHGTVTRCE